MREQELIPDTLLDELKRMAVGESPNGPLAALLQHIFDFDHAAASADIECLMKGIDLES